RSRRAPPSGWSGSAPSGRAAPSWRSTSRRANSSTRSATSKTTAWGATSATYSCPVAADTVDLRGLVVFAPIWTQRNSDQGRSIIEQGPLLISFDDLILRADDLALQELVGKPAVRLLGA